MGQKQKIGKARKDKFYQLAKESGYRARSAFKLLQLNRTYRFLEKSRICIDLCAAPGGWLQVAATHMPTNRVIIGVDLVSIKAISNVITHMNDITTEKCRQDLKRDMNNQKADCVLHDGAPNVGKNWIHDAYQQNMLVLQSFKLASEFLKKGGWFITKVFRSKDYYSIIWVFQQFFKKVEATKPQASRHESAEIFVVCQDYKCPDRIDPKFFDIKYVFEDVENAQAEANKKVTDLFKGEMGQRHRGGYADGDYTLYHKLNVSDFVYKENCIELLANSNEIVLDDDKITKCSATTTEIKECFKDIKILGKNEIRNLLKWRTKVRELLDIGKPKKVAVKAAEVIEGADSAKLKEVNADGDTENEDDVELEEQIKDALDSERKLEKKKNKKVLKEKRKLKEKINLKMEIPNDVHDIQGDNEVFSLAKIRTKQTLLDLQGALPGMEFSDEEDYDKEEYMTRKPKKMKFSKTDDKNDLYEVLENSIKTKGGGIRPKDEEGEDLDIESAEEEVAGSNSDNDVSDDNEEENPLLNDLTYSTKSEKRAKNTDLWFSKDSFDFLQDANEENNELLRCIEMEEEERAGYNEKKEKALNKKRKRAVVDDFKKDFLEAEGDEDNDVDYDDMKKEKSEREVKKESKKFETVPQGKLNAEELALGQMITNSKKTRSLLIDESYNKYSKFDTEENLPDWFIEDEEENYKKPPAVPKQIVHDYKKRFDDINARPIKKVVEAEARKKRRVSKKLDRARKKTEAISDNTDMTEKEKNLSMKAVYKRAGLLGKKKTDIKYVVSKRGHRGKQTKGKTGPYKLVDARLKKDKNFKKKSGANKLAGNKNGKPTKQTKQTKKKGAKKSKK